MKMIVSLSVVVLVVLSLNGCAGGDSQNEMRLNEQLYRTTKSTGMFNSKSHIDPEFIPYIQEFEKFYGKSIGINVRFGRSSTDKFLDSLGQKNGSDIIGSCEINPLIAKKEIFINRSLWAESSECIKKITLFHELGHCLLVRVHSNETIELEGVIASKSIMAEELSEEGCNTITSHMEYYVNELF